MSLHVDPQLTIDLIRRGKIINNEAVKQIKDILSEISSGVYSLEDVGIESEEELLALCPKTH